MYISKWWVKEKLRHPKRNVSNTKEIHKRMFKTLNHFRWLEVLQIPEKHENTAKFTPMFMVLFCLVRSQSEPRYNCTPWVLSLNIWENHRYQEFYCMKVSFLRFYCAFTSKSILCISLRRTFNPIIARVFLLFNILILLLLRHRIDVRCSAHTNRC